MEKFYVNPTVRAVSADLVEQLDQHTQPINQETPMSENTDKPKNHLVVSNPIQQVYLRALIIDPCISNNSLWDRIKGDPLLIGKKFDAQRSSQARTQLGITVERREMQRRVHINTAQFVAVAHGIGMKGYAVPQSFYSFPDAGQGSQPRAKAEETPSVTAAPPAPAPSAAPTPAPIPAPVVTPERVKPADPMAELKDLLSLVKIAMKELNIVDLHVTPDSVKFKQVTVLEGELAV
jgi:hypothetical protein